jgi:hypothetical protein
MASFFLKCHGKAPMCSGSENDREKGDGFSFSKAGTRTDYGFCVLDLGTNKSMCVLFQTLRKAEHCLLSSEVFNSWVYVLPFWN